jgi:glycosyltransferase involved in cell wall biosynthesis
MAKAYALLSTYPPTQCGLATFSAALFANLRGPGDHVGVVRVLDEPVPGEPPPRRAPEVVHDLVNGSAQSAAAAVDVINGCDVVIVQHEYGIYGGPRRAGRRSAALRVARSEHRGPAYRPARPTTRQRAILDDIIDAAGAVVTMTRTARTRLLDIYRTSPEKVFAIPHGSADDRVAVAPREASHPPMALTWGLLGPGKGIEHAIAAVALLRDRGRRVAYTVAGQTHPLAGPATRNKGMALFPRRIAGRHAALSRWDRESNAIAYSTDGRRWGRA